MYEVDFGWDDHERLRKTLGEIKGRFLLSYNDCPEIRELYEGFSLFDFTRPHSMAQRYEAGKQYSELLISNYDTAEWLESCRQMSLFDLFEESKELLKERKILWKSTETTESQLSAN